MSAEPDRTHQKPAFLKRVRIRNYKSIKFCDVELEPLTVLVGRNGSGKSNFVDALGFLRDVFEHGLGTAVRDHGGWSAVIHRDGEATELSFECEFSLNAERETDVTRTEPTWFDFELAVSFRFTAREDTHGRPTISTESSEYRVVGRDASFNFRRDGAVTRWEDHVPSGAGYPSLFLTPFTSLQHDSLMSAVIGTQPLIDVGNGCRTLGTYNFIPSLMREHQRPEPGGLLDWNGRNIASAIRGLDEIDRDGLHRVMRYLSVIVPNVVSFQPIRYGDRETVQFTVQQNGRQVVFDASSMSDGTLRVLATLIAAFQIPLPTGPSLVAIEEPETSLHPAASAALVDALDEATGRTQVLITTHSTELLDNDTIRPDNIRVVEMIDGETVVARVDKATVEIVERRLDTLGGLELQNQLHANYDDLRRQKALQEEGR